MLRNKMLTYSQVLCIAVVLFMLTACGVGATVQDGSGALVHNDQQEQMNRLNEKAEQLYRSVLAEQIDEARGYMIELEKMMTSIHYDGLVSIEGMSALTATIVTGKKLLNSTMISEDALHVAVTTLRIAVDALNDRKQPLWHQYESVLQNRLQSLMQAIERKDVASIRTEFAIYNESYQIVHPAIQIALSPEYGEQMTSMLIHMDQLIHENPPNIEAIHEHHHRIEQMITYLYHGDKESVAGVWMDTEARLFFSWYVGLATIIATVLAFVAWKKYRAQADYVFVHKNRDTPHHRKF